MLKAMDLRRRAHAAGIHLLLCTLVAALAATVVFGIWFPGVYRWASGGRDLFLLVTGVDIVLGPLLTFAVFNLKKGWRHLRRDLAVIGAIQIMALGYGLHTVFLVRPIAMIFEADRFRIITAGEVFEPELPKAPIGYRSLPLTGPWLLGTRALQPGDERRDAIFMALRGADVADRPVFWQEYSRSIPDVLAKSRPIAALIANYPSREAEIRAELGTMKGDPSNARFLPLVARNDWVAVIDGSDGLIRGYINANGFF